VESLLVAEETKASLGERNYPSRSTGDEKTVDRAEEFCLDRSPSTRQIASGSPSELRMPCHWALDGSSGKLARGLEYPVRQRWCRHLLPVLSRDRGSTEPLILKDHDGS
jgi:hypothetical protein